MNTTRQCLYCSGTGQQSTWIQGQKRGWRRVIKCKKCNGTGEAHPTRVTELRNKYERQKENGANQSTGNTGSTARWMP